MSTSTDGGRDADDWRERDWHIDDRVEVVRRVGRSTIGYIVDVRSNGDVLIWHTPGSKSHYIIQADGIRDMVRLVPEPHKVGDQVALPSRVTALEEHINLASFANSQHAQTIMGMSEQAEALSARVTKLETERYYADPHVSRQFDEVRRELAELRQDVQNRAAAGWVQPELQRRVERQEAAIEHLAERHTSAIVRLESWLDGVDERLKALERANWSPARDAQVADLLARVSTLEAGTVWSTCPQCGNGMANGRCAACYDPKQEPSNAIADLLKRVTELTGKEAVS